MRLSRLTIRMSVIVFFAVPLVMLSDPGYPETSVNDSKYGPSLPDTQKFISDTLLSCRETESSIFHENDREKQWKRLYQDVGWRANSILIRSRIVLESYWAERGRYNVNGSESVKTIDLAKITDDVESGKVEGGKFWVRLSCTQGACINGENRRFHSNESKNLQDYEIDSSIENIEESSVQLIVCHEGAAKALVKAFTHAIKKAGGKKPLF